MGLPAHKRDQIEQEFGKSLETVIVSQFAQIGSVSGVARALGVKQPTVSQWIKELGYEVKIKASLIKKRK